MSWIKALLFIFTFMISLAKTFSFLLIPVKLISRQAAAWSLILTHFSEEYTIPSNQLVLLVDPLYLSFLILVSSLSKGYHSINKQSDMILFLIGKVIYGFTKIFSLPQACSLLPTPQYLLLITVILFFHIVANLHL